MTYPFASLPENLAAFCALLRRDYRFRIGPGELQDAARALTITELGNERAVRDVLRLVLAARFEETQVFDGAFDRFFHGRVDVTPNLPSRNLDGRDDSQRREPEPGAPGESNKADPGAESSEAEDGQPGAGIAAILEAGQGDSEEGAPVVRASYSPLESEGAVPDLEPADRAWRDAASVLVTRVRARLSRRWRPAPHGQRFDFRRTLRSSLHTGGDLAIPRWRARRTREPRFVLLVDGSRSMAGYARPALQLAVALTAVSADTETFTFSTELRRVTPDVRRAAAGEARPLRLHHAWGGGTAIGASLDEFLRRAGDRTLRDAVAIISSDGLEFGDPELLRTSMAALSRRAAAIVWLNPLAATPGYEPTARGMHLARPFVAVLAAANDPAGLARIARTLRVR